MPDVFISYARTDHAFSDRLADALSREGREVWIDRRDIPPADRWSVAVQEGIEQSDAILFLLSQDSASSEACRKELGYAAALNKRLVVVCHDEPRRGQDIPEMVAASQWIFVRDEDDFHPGVKTVLAALDTDLEARRLSTRILVRAIAWHAAGRPASRVLHGAELTEAEDLLARSATTGMVPTDLQREFVAASRQAATRRSYRIAATALVVAAVSVGLAIFAFIQRGAAIANQETAKSSALAARAESLVTSQPDLSADLALRAMAIRQTQDAESALRAALPNLQSIQTLIAGSAVSDAAFSPDGSHVLTATTGGRARIWNASTGRPTPVGISASGQPIDDAQFSSGGDRIVTVTTVQHFVPELSPAPGGPLGLQLTTVPSATTTTVAQWDASDGARVGPTLVLSGRNRADHAEFSPDGQLILTSGGPAGPRLWRAQSARPVPMRSSAAAAYVTDAHFSPSGRFFVTAGSDGTARVWSVGRRQPTHVIVREPSGAPIEEARFSTNGLNLVTASTDGTARIWSATTGQATGVILHEPSAGVVTDAEFGPHDRLIVTASEDGSARVWDAVAGTQVSVLAGHTAPVTSAAFDRSGRLLVTASTDGTARTWDPLPRQRITVFTEPSASAIRCAIVSGDQVVTGSADGYIRVWSLATGKPLMTMREPGGGAINDVEEFVPFSDINSLTLSAGPLKELLLTASSDGTARVWNADNGRATGVVLREPGGAAINAVRTTTDNRLILTASSDGTARVWSETNGRPTGQVFTPGDGGGLTSIEFDSGFSPQTLQETGVPGLTIPTPEAPGFPDVGSHLLLTDRSGQATIWSLTTNKETAVITEPGRAAIDAGAFDGRYVMTASEDGTVRIWNPSADPYTTDSPPVTSWAPRLTMAEPGGSSIDTAALDSGDNLIVTGSVDGYARVWDAATGKALAGFQPSGQVLAASFGASGQGVIVVSSDGSASMWSIIPARTVPRLRALAESLLPPRLSGQDQSYLARVSG